VLCRRGIALGVGLGGGIALIVTAVCLVTRFVEALIPP
jgi:hypothetical protein